VNFAGKGFLTEILMMLLFVLFCFYSYVILQFVVVRVVKEYTIIVVQSLIFLNSETHNAATFWGNNNNNISCAINGNFSLFQRI
jgi:hypothetical protein